MCSRNLPILSIKLTVKLDLGDLRDSCYKSTTRVAGGACGQENGFLTSSLLLYLYRDQWKNYEDTYHPQFTDGWAPEYPHFPDETSDMSGSKRRPDVSSFYPSI